MRSVLTGGACLALLFTAGSLSPPLRADAAADPAAADAAYRAHEWARAAPLYQALARTQPDSFLYALRLAECLRHGGERERALASYEQALAHGAPASEVQYGIALTRAAGGDAEGAFTALTAAVRQGHGRPDLMRAEPALERLKPDARFAALLAQAQHNQAPCGSRAESRQFDFWVGDWQVVSSAEHTLVGKSHIERTIGECVIWENWTSLGESGYTGKSYNVYNPDLKRWEQFWVDNQGGMIHFYGALIEGVMDFRTDPIPQPDGKTLRRRLRFYHLGPDRVRQFSEGSTDDGKTWSTEYDFTYDRAR
jgi:tetratricopeptide (TPR) repeat protein